MNEDDPKLVEVWCIDAYDPPMVLIVFAGLYSVLVPYGTYNDLRGPLGLPDNPCDVTGPGV